MAEGVFELSDYLKRTPPPHATSGIFACFITPADVARLLVSEDRRRKSLYPRNPKEARQPVLEGDFRLQASLLELIGRTVSLIPLTQLNYLQYTPNINIAHDTALGEVQLSRQPLRVIVSIPFNSGLAFPVYTPIVT